MMGKPGVLALELELESTLEVVVEVGVVVGGGVLSPMVTLT